MALPWAGKDDVVGNHFLKSGFIIRQEVFNEKEEKEIYTGIQRRSG
jgi:hypothetical protein